MEQSQLFKMLLELEGFKVREGIGERPLCPGVTLELWPRGIVRGGDRLSNVLAFARVESIEGLAQVRWPNLVVQPAWGIPLMGFEWLAGQPGTWWEAFETEWNEKVVPRLVLPELLAGIAGDAESYTARPYTASDRLTMAEVANARVWLHGYYATVGDTCQAEHYGLLADQVAEELESTRTR